MDIPIEQPSHIRRLTRRYIAIGIVLLCLVLLLLYLVLGDSPTRISRSDLIFETLVEKPFLEKVVTRGTIVPRTSIVIDMDEGGRVISSNFEAGDEIKKGDVIAQLENTELRLAVAAVEADLSEQENSLRNTRIQMERDSLSVREDIQKTKFKIQQLSQQIERREPLAKKGLISSEDFTNLKDELIHNENLLQIYQQRQSADIKFRKSQIELLEAALKRLELQGQLSRASLERLRVVSPIDGILTSYDVQLGQQFARGERLAVLDSDKEYDVSVFLSEYYLNRLAEGVTGTVTVNGAAGKGIDVIVNRIFPSVNNAQFEARLKFVDESVVPTLKKGQSVAVQLVLSEEDSVLVAAKEAIFKGESGDWLFVYDDKSGVASRKLVVTGKRNAQLTQILEGVNKSEVIVYSNELFLGNEINFTVTEND